MKREELDIIIIVGIMLVLASVYVIYSEVTEARSFCGEGVYGFNILKGKYYCNGEEIAKFNDGEWDFVKNRIDFSDMPPILTP